MAQMLGRNRPQSTCWRTAAAEPAGPAAEPAGLATGLAGLAAGLPGPGSGVPNPAEPWVNSSPAHCLANTPFAGPPPAQLAGPPLTRFAGPPPAAFGNSAVARLFHALCATTALIRWS